MGDGHRDETTFKRTSEKKTAGQKNCDFSLGLWVGNEIMLSHRQRNIKTAGHKN